MTHVTQPPFRVAIPQLPFRRSVIALCAVLLSISGCVVTSPRSYGNNTEPECRGIMQWPVRPAELLQDFDAPAQVWLPGHRGVDVDADSGMLIFAPQGGTIVFSGRVAHKDVVVIEHAHGWRSTFEPAITTLSVGTKVQRGQSIAQISDGGSDHCQDACLHWGVKIDKKRYLNPRLLTEVRPITILPLLE